MAKSLLVPVLARKQVVIVILDEVVDLDVMPVQLPGGRSLGCVPASAVDDVVSKQEQALCRLGFYDVCMRAPGGRARGGVHNLIVKLCPLHGRRTGPHRYDQGKCIQSQDLVTGDTALHHGLKDARINKMRLCYMVIIKPIRTRPDEIRKIHFRAEAIISQLTQKTCPT